MDICGMHNVVGKNEEARRVQAICRAAPDTGPVATSLVRQYLARIASRSTIERLPLLLFFSVVSFVSRLSSMERTGVQAC